jgi:biopolymer transport protein ExbD
MLVHPDPEHVDGTEPADEGFYKRTHKRRKFKMDGESISHLNLTPMMDIMTILLVFLIQSFATEPANINVSLDLRPPESDAATALDAATKVTITAREILVDDIVVASIDQLGMKPGQKEIPLVRDALIERADHLRAIHNLGGPEFDGRLLLVAHQTTPYSLITAVLYSAGQAKFGQYKLVVMKKGSGE